MRAGWCLLEGLGKNHLDSCRIKHQMADVPPDQTGPFHACHFLTLNLGIGGHC